MAQRTTAGRPRGKDELGVLCGEIASIFRRTWGRGPVQTSAYWAGSDILVVLLENGHTDAEKTLRAAGHIQELVGGRQLLQVIIEDELCAAVEAAVGRQVVTMLSATRLDPDLSAEIFVLVPKGAGAPPSTQDSLTQRSTDAQSRSEGLGREVQALLAQRDQIRRRRRHPEGTEE